MTTVKDFVTNVNHAIDEINRQKLPEKGANEFELKVMVKYELQKIIQESKDREKLEPFEFEFISYEADYISICKTFRLKIQRLIPNKRNPKIYLVNRVVVADKFLNKNIEDILNKFVDAKLSIINDSQSKAKATADLIKSYLTIDQLHEIIADIKSNKYDSVYSRTLRTELQIKDII